MLFLYLSMLLLIHSKIKCARESNKVNARPKFFLRSPIFMSVYTLLLTISTPLLTFPISLFLISMFSYLFFYILYFHFFCHCAQNKKKHAKKVSQTFILCFPVPLDSIKRSPTPFLPFRNPGLL